MSPALIQLFAFMTCTFLLGVFLGWSLWRYGGVSRAAMNDLEAKAQFWKKSLDQSRMELWNLQEGKPVSRPMSEHPNRPVSRRRVVTRPSSENALPSNPSQSLPG